MTSDGSTATRRPPHWRSPVVLFLLASLLLGAVIFIGTNVLADRAAQEAALEQAEAVNELLAHSAAEPYVQLGLVQGNPIAAEKFFRKAGNLTEAEGVRSVDLYSADGTLIYSTTNLRAPEERPRYQLSERQQAVLRGAGTDSELADPGSPRSQDRDGDETGLVRIYTRIEATPGRRSKQPTDPEPVLFVAYWELEGVEARRGEIFGDFRWISLGPLVLLVLISTVLLAVLTQQVRRGSRERERLLQTAIDASDAERRRIARDLHDGVVQDLAGSGFALSGAARDPSTTPATAQVLDSVGASLRDSLKQMRSLLAEIHPPELHGRGLETALEDLIAPAAAAGIHASVSVSGVENASDPEVALVWRVAQEAVRNATRHSGASTLAVTVRGDEEQLLLEVVDDGVGFDTTAPSEPDRFGLRGLRSLVRDVGGELDVTSAVGEGTSVRMAVRR